MKKTKFEKEFRDAFLGDVRPPEGSFKYFEDKLGLERKKPFHKRRPILLNTIVVSVFIVIMLLSNVLVYSLTLKKYYQNIESHDNLEIYLREKFNDYYCEEVFLVSVEKNEFKLYLLQTSDFKTYCIYNEVEIQNTQTCILINDVDICNNTDGTVQIEVSNKETYFNIIKIETSDIYNINIRLFNENNDDFLVNFYSDFTFKK